MAQSPFDRVFPLLYSKTLETFLIVCQTRSFTKTAAIVGLSQSAVSQSILRLEESLGVTLFTRHVRPVLPTQEAEILRAQIENQFAEMASTVARIRQDNALKPVIRVGVVESLSPNVAPELVRVLSPAANRISVLTGTSNGILDQLLKHEVDVIVSSDPFNDVDGITRCFLFEEPHVLIVPQALGATWTDPDWERLQYCGLPVVRYASRSSSGKLIESHLARLRLSVPARFEADTSRVVFALVAEGIGWALTTPLCLLQCSDMVARLCVLPAPAPALSREIHVITRKGESHDLAESVVSICLAQLRRSIIPALLTIAPWITPDLAVVAGDRINRIAVD